MARSAGSLAKARAGSILFVSGATGAGETSAVQVLARRASPGIRCHHFDSIGVPSPGEMVRDFGGPERWQADATRTWVRQLREDDRPGAVDLLDGQIRPSFILDALAVLGDGIPSSIVLLDCSARSRRARLAARGQAELANVRMTRWAAFVRAEAAMYGCAILSIETSTVDAIATQLETAARRLDIG